jgi:hypothetical protein
MASAPSRLFAACAVAMSPTLAGGQPPVTASASEEVPVIVHLADGASLPLRAWTLSYEYVAWPVGSSQAMGAPGRRDTRALWIARKPMDTAGLVLELKHQMVPRDPGEAASGPAEIPTVRRLRLSWPGGRKQDVKVEPPHRDLLVPGGAKNVTVVPRSLDLHGETLTGTRRELCVLSYTSLVECGVERAGRVVKLEFPGKE